MLFTKTENNESWNNLVIKRAFVSGCITGIAFMLSVSLLVGTLLS